MGVWWYIPVCTGSNYDQELLMTRKNPYPSERVWVFLGFGFGFSWDPRVRKTWGVFETGRVKFYYLKITQRRYIHYLGPSHSAARSSSSPANSAPSTALMSESLIKPNRLQAPTHIQARVDWTDRRLRICGSKSRPWLNTRSTSTVVAEKKP